MKETAEILRDLLPNDNSLPDPDALVFKVGTPSAFSMRVGRLMTDAGLGRIRYHDLRREATTRLAKRYRSAADLRRVTGHTDGRIMDRYYEPDPGDLACQGDDEAF